MNKATKTLAVSLSALSLAASLTGCGPSTFDAKGKIEDPTIRGAQCDSKMFRAVKTGDEVKVQAKGNTVAMGKVGTVKLDDRSAAGHGYICSFDFTVTGVPAGEKFYTVVVANQGQKEVSEEDLSTGKALLETPHLDNKPA
ncbi:hypothetical protein [Arthrobacter bambusae]|uniref:hypothetical protein n=1 Tax=Arthrobacter bambusae TaxID=1338426 RepID=UPI00277F1E67|nr:hypothetical protein [Arthrobacter bambusae]MDQ0241400.1 putative carbohydrate-binding protein with CBM5 and CBM33 domain [Arthrobacter bambusae]